MMRFATEDERLIYGLGGENWVLDGDGYLTQLQPFAILGLPTQGRPGDGLSEGESQRPGWALFLVPLERSGGPGRVIFGDGDVQALIGDAKWWVPGSGLLRVVILDGDGSLAEFNPQGCAYQGRPARRRWGSSQVGLRVEICGDGKRDK